MTTNINTEQGQKYAPEWSSAPFGATATQIVAGFVECEELQTYYFKKYEKEAKNKEIESLISH